MKDILTGLSKKVEEQNGQLLLTIGADFNDGDIETNTSEIKLSFLKNNIDSFREAFNDNQSILNNPEVKSTFEDYLPSIEDCDPHTIDSIELVYVPVSYKIEF